MLVAARDYTLNLSTRKYRQQRKYQPQLKKIPTKKIPTCGERAQYSMTASNPLAPNPLVAQYDTIDRSQRSRVQIS